VIWVERPLEKSLPSKCSINSSGECSEEIMGVGQGHL
jgi:hypothetical protein